MNLHNWHVSWMVLYLGSLYCTSIALSNSDAFSQLDSSSDDGEDLRQRIQQLEERALEDRRLIRWLVADRDRLRKDINAYMAKQMTLVL